MSRGFHEMQRLARVARWPRAGVEVLLLAVWWLCALDTVQCQVLRDDFSRGDRAPAGWTLNGTGEWSAPGQGQRTIRVSGNGEDVSYWSRTVPGLRGNQTYAVRFRARALPGASQFTLISGLDVCNRDYATGPAWTTYSFAFTTPSDVSQAFLRLGQWHLKGTLEFADVALMPVEAVHRSIGGLTLGAGERVRSGRYEFRAPFNDYGSNASRCLATHTAPFNTNRWVFSGGLYVVYRHACASYSQTEAEVIVNVNYHVGGQLVVSLSTNGTTWEEIGRATSSGSYRFPLPAGRLPAKVVWIRLSGASATDPAGNSAPGSFQIDGYTYRSTLEGSPPDAVGGTHYVQITRQSPEYTVHLRDLSDLGRSASGCVRLAVTSRQRVQGTVVGRLIVTPAGRAAREEFAESTQWKPDRGAELAIPYRISASGELECRLALRRLVRGQEVPIFEATVPVYLPPYYREDYGHSLSPVPDGELWWCESTYKVPPERLPPPQKYSASLTELRSVRGRGGISLEAARREREHAQLVFRPVEDPGPVHVTVSTLSGPGGHTIPATALEVREVAYVTVTQPTDRTGVVGEWPDPLPPLSGAWRPRAGRNNVLWITVTVPASAQAGTYTGRITLRAPRWTREIALRLKVWDFILPERTALRSGFGVDPGMIARYHNLKSPGDMARVWDSYMEAFRKRRIAPYNPMALAPYHVQVEGVHWTGGTRDTDRPASGKYCLRVEDNSPTADILASHARLIPLVPGRRYVLSWKARTAQAGQEYMVTVGHFDAAGVWMRGRNNDIVRVGGESWTTESAEIGARIPPDAAFVQVVLRPVVWTERGDRTGTAWFDDLSLIEASEPHINLLDDGGFENAENPSVRLDFTEFDKAARKYLDGMGFNAFTVHIQGLPGGRFPNFDHGSFFGFAAGTPEYDALMSEYGRKLEEHLERNGWLGKAYVYWYDEPEEGDYPIVREGAERLKRYFPRLKRMMTEQFEEPLYGFVDLWCPISPLFDQAKARARQKLGEEVWWYVCTAPKEPYCTLFIDKPAIELRMWLWQTWQRGIQGILIWATTWWTSPNQFRDDQVQNPWEDPMSYVADVSGVWGNGDGRFFYPPNRDPNGDRATPYLTGPIDSLRWEMLGEGIEDWEYFGILQEAIRRAEAAGRKDDVVRRARALLTVPPEITSDLTHFTTDPQRIYRHRRLVAEAIEALGSDRKAAPASRTRH